MSPCVVFPPCPEGVSKLPANLFQVDASIILLVWGRGANAPHVKGGLKGEGVGVPASEPRQGWVFGFDFDAILSVPLPIHNFPRFGDKSSVLSFRSWGCS